MKKLLLIALIACCAPVLAVEQYDTIFSGQDTIILHIHPLPTVYNDSTVTHKAPAASCPTDSVVTKDSLGNNIEMTEYFYQNGKEAGSASWRWVNGTKQGVSKTQKMFDASNREILNATYTWSTAKSDWKLTVCTETTYNNAGKNTDTKLYIGETADGQWKGSTYYHYDYDSSGRTILSLYYTWNDNTNTWQEQDKWEYEFADGYPSASYYWQKQNGEWVGVEKKVWAYAGSNVVNEEIYTGWADGNWIGSTRTATTYNAGGQITQLLTYIWSDGWVEHEKTIREYDGANTTEDAKYRKSGEQWVGVSRTTATFSGSAKLTQTTWTWNNNNATWQEATQYTYSYAYTNKIAEQVFMHRQGDSWLNVEKTVNLYNDKKYVTSTTISRWQNDAWLDSLQTRHTYNSSNQDILTVKAKFANGQWLSTDSTKWVMEYVTINGKQKKTYDEKATWTLATGAWKGTSKYTYEYDEAGNTLQYDTYTFKNGKWLNNQRQTYTYKDLNANLKTLEQKMTWNDALQAWVGNSRTERTFNDANKQLTTATYTWSTAKKDWQGKSKSETVYTDGIQTAAITYQWNNDAWDWLPKSMTQDIYDGSRRVQQLVLTYNTATQAYDNQTRYDYSYNANGVQYRTDTYTWIAAEQRWCKQSHTESAYDAAGGKLRSENKSQWQDCQRKTYNTTYYHYSCDNPAYTIAFLDWDSTQLAVVTALQGSTPAFPAERSEPTRDSDAQYTYTFSGWGNGIVAAASDTSYVAAFATTLNKYTITFANEDGSVIEANEYEYGTMPVAPAEPTKEATAQYTYTFAGWDKTIVSVTGAETYTATYTQTVNKYTITFANEDSSVIEAKEYEYGTMPVAPAEPTKDATAQYTYTFAGWDKTIVSVTGAETYTATFTQTVNKYTITFANEDGSVIEANEYEYGTMPVAPAEPAKDATAQYTYTFAGWDKTIVAVTGTETYTATFATTLNKYIITFANEDGSVIEAKEYEYGTTPLAPTEPAKDATAQYTYTFSGWDKEIVAVTGATTYTATYTQTVNKYTITFANEDGSVIEAKEYEYGSIPEAPADPTKEATTQYTYTFSGWDKEIAAVTGATTYTATYTQTVNKYTITFANEDGSVIEANEYEYGTMPVAPTEPTKDATAQYTYTFSGWDKEIVAVAGAETYTATYTQTVNKYTITFANEDGSVIEAKEYEYGTMPVAPTEPTKDATAQYTYTFSGWDKTIVEVTGAETYTATFTATLNKYLITFVDEDGTTVLYEEEVAYGETPVYGGELPTKEEDADYTYTFSGWSPAIEAVSGTATYYATYTAEEKLGSGIGSTSAAEPATKVMENGVLYIIRGGQKYTATGAAADASR